MIDADRFHSAFAAGFERQFQGRALERSGDKRPCWTTRVAGRLFVMAFPLDRGTSVPPFGPSLFHDHFVWHGPISSGEGTIDFVDHANEAERQHLRRLQDFAYVKAERACDAEKPLWRDLGRAYLAPVRQMIDSGTRLDDHHLFVCSDEDDARAWGEWFGSAMEGWMTRFEAWHGAPAKKVDKAA